MIKKSYNKYIFVLIVLFAILLSSCSNTKKNYELYTSAIDELYEIDNDINDAEYYSSFFWYGVSNFTKGLSKDIDDYKSCVVKKDLSYIRQNTRDSYCNYYSIINDEVYSIEESKVTNRDNNDNYIYTKDNENDFNISKLDDYTLEDILGFSDVKKLKIDIFNGKNGEITISNYENTFYYTIKMQYSIIKDEPLVKDFLEIDELSYTKAYLTDDTSISLTYYLNKEKSKIEFDFGYFTTIDGDEIHSFVKYEKYISKLNYLEIDFTQQKNIYVEEEQNINILPLGEETLGFIPKYSGYYDININLTNPVDVILGNEKYSGSNISSTIFLNSKEKYYIKIKGQDAFSKGTAKITYSVKMDNISIKGNDECVIKINRFTGLKNIFVNIDNIAIRDIMVYSDDNKYVHDYEYIFCPSVCGPSAACIFDESKDYILFLKNQTEETIDDISIIVSNPEKIEINSNNEITIDNNHMFYKIDNKIAGQYIVSGLTGEVSLYKMLDLDYNRFSIDFENEISMNSNKTYYIGFYNNENKKYKIEICKKNNEYQWEITGGKYSSYRTFENSIKLETGYTYYLKFIVNGEEVESIYYNSTDYKTSFGRYDLRISSNGELEIPKNTLLGGTGISITAKNEGKMSYSHELDVIPVLNENDISISTYNTEGLGFIASVPKYVNSIKYCIEIGENKIYSEAINSDYKKSFIITKDILDDLKEYGFNNYNGEMTLTIYEISVIDAYKNIITYNFNYSCSLYNVIK